MTINNWTDRYSLGVAKLDSYHRQLFSQFNLSSEDFITKNSATDLHTLLDQLVDYGIYQMYAEELWMHNNQFPGLEKHRGVHEWISRRVLAIQEEVRDRNGPLSLEILSALHALLKGHILSSDEIITDFIVAREEDIVDRLRYDNRQCIATTRVVFHETTSAEGFAA